MVYDDADVFILATDNSSTKPADLAQLVRDKLQDLASEDVIRRAKAESTEEDVGFLARLGKKIVDNLQVTVRNVHVRFEHPTSASGE